MQDRFATRLFAAVKQMGVHTAIETNGYYGERLTDDEIKNIDLVILDMKAFAREQHQRVTGMSTTMTFSCSAIGWRAQKADVAPLRARSRTN